MVYFDNLQVTHERARLIEENHYYAYGLKIAGISSRKLPDAAEAHIKNEYLYNDKELIDDGDLNWYDYGFRNYDAQIGRFPQLDPLTDDYPYQTPYQYADCDPIMNIDLDGLEGQVVTVAAQTSIRITAAAPTVINTAATITKIASGANALSKGFTLANIASISIRLGQTAANTENNQVGIPEQVKGLITHKEFDKAADLTLKSYPELNDPDLEGHKNDPKSGAHITYSIGKGKSLTIFGQNIFEQYGWGYMSFGYFYRTILHEIQHVKVNSQKILLHRNAQRFADWNGETEVIAYTEMYLNTTAPKFDPSKLAEKNNIRNDKIHFKAYYEKMPKEGQDFYKSRYEAVMKKMDELLK
jgi:RHS repeat-associated protein